MMEILVVVMDAVQFVRWRCQSQQYAEMVISNHLMMQECMKNVTLLSHGAIIVKLDSKQLELVEVLMAQLLAQLQLAISVALVALAE
jgi:hypothetical protein